MSASLSIQGQLSSICGVISVWFVLVVLSGSHLCKFEYDRILSGSQGRFPIGLDSDDPTRRVQGVVSINDFTFSGKEFPIEIYFRLLSYWYLYYK